jgi:hypothetical protein
VWENGKKETLEFAARYKDKAIHFDTDRIFGRAFEADDKNILLSWTRKDIPYSYLHEMIQISDDGQSRFRTWHWIVDNVLAQRTLIQERKFV